MLFRSYDMKRRGYERPANGYRPIHMPRNTGAGVIISFLALVMGFGMVWYMWWLAALGFAGIVVLTIGHSFNRDRDYFIPADEVERIETARATRLAGAGT